MYFYFIQYQLILPVDTLYEIKLKAKDKSDRIFK